MFSANPCLSSEITWAGFDNFYYFFSYEDSRDAFDIPDDVAVSVLIRPSPARPKWVVRKSRSGHRPVSSASCARVRAP